MSHAKKAALDRLRAHLATIVPGKITDTTDLEPLLAACWGEFSGDYGGMEGYKLLGRIEDVTWGPPTLTFTIERHGGTVMGSSRAELQHWEVKSVEERGQVANPSTSRNPGRGVTNQPIYGGTLMDELGYIAWQDDGWLARLTISRDGERVVALGHAKKGGRS
jgi:hypothetical protein